MPVNTTYDYTDSINYTFDSQLVEFTGTSVQLRLQQSSLNITDTISSDTGAVYDSNLVEFNVDRYRQKDQVPSDNLIGIKYDTDLNANYSTVGALTPTSVNGTPTIVSGYAEMIGVHGVQYEYNSNPSNGAMRFKYVPDYTNLPATNVNLVVLENDTGSQKIAVTHSPAGGGSFRIWLTDDGGVIYTATAIGHVVMTAGQEYEFELNWTSTGTVQLFVDGASVGTLSPAPFTISGTDYSLYVGATSIVYNVAEGSFSNVAVFDAVQHTVDYTPDAGLPSAGYLESTVELAEFNYTSTNADAYINGLLSTANTATAATRYTIKTGSAEAYLYHDGFSWVVSDGTYAQSNTEAEVNAALSSIPTNDGDYIRLRAHFPSDNNRSDIQATSVNYTALDSYPTTSPTVVTNSAVQMDLLENFEDTSTGTVTHCLVISSQDYYHDGAEWVISNGTAAQSNTAVDIAANASSLGSLIELGATVKVKSFLTTASVNTTPDLDQVALSYSFYIGADTIPTTTVYGYAYNNGVPVEGAVIDLDTTAPYYLNNNLIDVNTQVVSRSNGYYEVDLPRTSESSSTIKVKMKYIDERGETKLKTYNINVTAAAAQERIEDLIV